MEINKIYQGNSLDILKTFEDDSIDCCVTSPPYYGLRDYGTGKWVGGDPDCPHKRMSKYSDKTITGHAQTELRGNVGDAIYKTICPLCGAVRVDEQIGLEETPEDYIDRLVNVFHEVKRVLKDGGTLWVNIGDTYADKSLIGIPWKLAFALKEDGWYLRQDIIWQKPNPLPESVKDRCTKSHEYIFLLSKSPQYYFNYESIQEKAVTQDANSQIKFGGNKYGDNTDKHYDYYSGNEWKPRTKNCQYDGQTPNTMHLNREIGVKDKQYIVRNKRDVWSVTPTAYNGAHFATFPEDLIYPMIIAGCPKDGVVLDPFIGSGTVGVVAKHNYRNYVGCELNPDYVKMAERRIKYTLSRLF